MFHFFFLKVPWQVINFSVVGKQLINALLMIVEFRALGLAWKSTSQRSEAWGRGQAEERKDVIVSVCCAMNSSLGVC